MRLIVASNRLPIAVKKTKKGISLERSPGGVASGIRSFLENISTKQKTDWTWIGWPEMYGDAKLQNEIIEKAKLYNSIPIFYPEKVKKNFYNGFCNETIWPLFHYFPTYCNFKNEYYDDYKKVNMQFAKKIAEIATNDDQILIQDYQLMLVPKYLREIMPNARIGFFLHIPFPSFEIFRILPSVWRKELLVSLLSANLVGFHTTEYNKYFLEAVEKVLDYSHSYGNIIFDKHLTKTGTFPFGIDYDSFSNSYKLEKVQKYKKKLQDKYKNLKLITSIDRLDYSKGIINRLKSFEIFLTKNPKYHKKIALLVILGLSRDKIQAYKKIKRQIDEYVGRINGTFSSLDWTPVSYHCTSLTFEELIALYDISDIALVTPLRDGMNLIAKEYIAAHSDKKGVLILSEMAGASKELTDAIIINPYSTDEITAAIKEALEMSGKEKYQRSINMREKLKSQTIQIWGRKFLHSLNLSVDEEKKLLFPNKKQSFHKKIYADFEKPKIISL